MARPGHKASSPRGCGHCGHSVESQAVRCACGSLLARQVAGGIELKCRRCKRAIVIPVHAEE